jgi:cytochrome d ubiquinol oxidase subunit I
VTIVDGELTGLDPIAGMFNPSTAQQAVHMLIAAYAATALAVAGLHAVILRRKGDSAFHRRAMMLALAVGVPAAILQPVSGDFSARVVAQWQPIKLAALEGNFETKAGAPLRIGGIPDADAMTTRYAIEIPHGLSLLAFHDPNAVVLGLKKFSRDYWPPLIPVHMAFQLMVGLGTAMALVGLWVAITHFRKRDIVANRALLLALAIITPFGFIATEAGWTVTEVGRQPWVVVGLVKTADAVTPMRGLVYPMVLFTLLYIGLSVIVVVVMRSIVAETTA